MSPKELLSSAEPDGIFFLEAPSSIEVIFAGILMTSQWTQFWATGWGSTIDKANDLVPAGRFFQANGMEVFFPPAHKRYHETSGSVPNPGVNPLLHPEGCPEILQLPS